MTTKRVTKRKLKRHRKPARLRGLLPTPPQVAKIVAREVKTRPMSPEARQRLTNGFALQYYHGGQWIGYRSKPEGVEIVAIGLDEIGELVERVPPEERRDVVFTIPDPW